jgi:hypothetical protein
VRKSKSVGRPPGQAQFTQKAESGQVAAKGFKRLTFYTPDETARRVKAAAVLEGIPTSELLNRIINVYLKTARVPR